jgi:micrococcal nuclease
MQVYIHRDGQNLGPYSVGQLRPYLQAGNFTGNDLACHDGANWVALKDVPGVIKRSGKRAPRASKPKIQPVPVSQKSPKGLLVLLGLGFVATLLIGIATYFLLSEQEEPAITKKPPISAFPNLLDLEPEQVVEVYDGDTFKIDLEGVHPLFGDNLPIRVKGIDTPEIRGTSDEVKNLAVQARELTKNTLMSAQKIELRNPERGKYFRIVAEVWVDGKALADMLKEKGLAKDYDGEGERPEW